jgi:hypothetical protein
MMHARPGWVREAGWGVPQNQLKHLNALSTNQCWRETPRGCCRRLVGNRVFRKKLAGLLDAPLPFLWNIKSDDMGIAVGCSVPATTRGHFRRAGSESESGRAIADR